MGKGKNGVIKMKNSSGSALVQKIPMPLLKIIYANVLYVINGKVSDKTALDA